MEKAHKAWERAELALIAVILLIDIAFVLGGFFIGGTEFREASQAFLSVSLIWLGFLGASLAVRGGRNIAIDAITPFVAESQRRRLGILVSVAATIGCLLLAAVALVFFRAKMGIELGDRPQAGFLPQFQVYSRVVYPFMLFVMALKFMVEPWLSPADEPLLPEDEAGRG